MEQEPNYGRQREPGDEPDRENEEQRRPDPASEAETSYTETSPSAPAHEERSYEDRHYGGSSYGDPGYGDPGYRDPGYGGANYGHHSYGEPGYGGVGMAGTMSPQDEKTWSIISHLSVLAGLVGLMPLGALVVWLIYRDRSPMVRFHAVQALWYQLSWVILLAVGWFVTVILTFVLIGFLLIPVMAIASIIPFIHGCYGAYKVSQGEEFRYPFIADRIENTYRTH